MMNTTVADTTTRASRQLHTFVDPSSRRVGVYALLACGAVVAFLLELGIGAVRIPIG